MNTLIKKQIFSALFAALISVMTLITIPSPTGIPITFQTFAVALCGFTLGWKYGIFSIIIYLSAGFLGIPVFSGLTGGPGTLLGMTGGFLIGFIPFAALCGISCPKFSKTIYSVLGLISCHTLGIVWFIFITKSDILTALMTVSIPYLIKDIISLFAALIISDIIKKKLDLINI